MALFGALHRFGEGPCKVLFYEQIHANLVCLVMHLLDEDDGVRRASKKALQQLGPLLQAEPVNELFQQTLDENKSLQYAEFIHTLGKRLVRPFLISFSSSGDWLMGP